MKTIPTDVLNFLESLQKNNNREWFENEKQRFKKLEKQMKSFQAEVAFLLSMHDEIEDFKSYRIYRDLRFSKDKTPYKTHFGAYFMRKKPALRGGYYLEITPGKSLAGAGFWKPSKDDLYRVRKEWETDPEEIQAILQNPDFKKHWGSMQGDQLKTAPRGFDKENPNIRLINYKQWLFSRTYSDREVLSENFAETVNQQFRTIRPFFDYMSEILTTDLNGVSIL